MTSTVVIGNSYGVACATDTVGTLEGVPRKNGRRTNDGEIKLQGLKKPHAVAILGWRRSMRSRSVQESPRCS